MRVLIVGAGAVGQVYGYFLKLGGADVSFYVREKYAAELREELRLYVLNRGLEAGAVRWEASSVLTDLAAVAEESWDQVWLAVSSPALRGGWLGPLAEAIGEARLVALQPGLEDRDFVLEHAPADRVIWGVITFLAYQSPLPGEEHSEPGIACWIPPFSRTVFSGEDGPAIEALTRSLSEAGLRAERIKDACRWSAVPSAIMMPMMAALELSGWSFAGLRGGAALSVGAKAARENLRLVSVRTGRWTWHIRWVMRAWIVALASRFAPRFVPFDLESYLAYHFSKVGDQTRALLARSAALCAERGLGHAAIDAQVAALSEADAAKGLQNKV